MPVFRYIVDCADQLPTLMIDIDYWRDRDLANLLPGGIYGYLLPGNGLFSANGLPVFA